MRASRPTAARGRVPFPLGRAFAMVCRGGIYPSRGTLRRREPGGYGICPYRGLWRRRAGGFPAGRHVAPARRAGVHARRTLGISKIGTLRRRGVRRDDEGIPPYGRPGGRVPFPFGRAFATVCRGGIYPSRGTLPCREPGGYGIRPHRGLWQREACGFRRAAMLAPARRAGVHARRTLEISKNGALLPQGPDHFQHPRTPAPSTNARKISSPAGPLFSGWNCRPVTLARCTAAQTSRPPNSITAAQSCARAGRAW